MENPENDLRAAKLALARKKLKDHQEKKLVPVTRDFVENFPSQGNLPENNNNQLRENIDNANCERTKLNQGPVIKYKEPNDMDINVTEILISNKRNLEMQVSELESKLSLLTSTHSLEINNHNATKQQLTNIQNELKHMNVKYVSAMDNILQQDNKIKELTSLKTSICDENNNLSEQLEFTKAILSAKETENASLRNHLQQLQNEFDVTKLQLQQLNTGLSTSLPNGTSNAQSEQNEILLQKVNALEQQLNVTQKERDQINIHYENYVGELNEQLKSVMLKNEELSKTVQNLSIRENSLIEQISEMEIRLQNFQLRNKETVENRPQATDHDNMATVEGRRLEEEYSKAQEELQDTKKKLIDLQHLYAQSELKLKELQEVINSNSLHDNVSISKLTADIASDKVAAQRATEQNKKLKTSMQELEEAFVKMSEDKLELTEKLAAEKYLNRELTIKLAEIEEKSKSMHTKLMAKDEEMIRLQVTYRNLEKELDQLFAQTPKIDKLQIENNEEKEKETIDLIESNNKVEDELCETNDKFIREHLKEKNTSSEENLNIPQEDAMFKLQERFMKIMGEVADLSDEKHRLEHIILQLQNETDTICEYVALYQQQRSLLKKRDEERSAQIQLFQVECDRLKNQLEELSGILIKFAEDKELATYFQVESRQKDMDKVRSLLLNLKRNTLVDPKNSLELSNVYPCNCCSGNLIDV